MKQTYCFGPIDRLENDLKQFRAQNSVETTHHSLENSV